MAPAVALAPVAASWRTFTFAANATRVRPLIVAPTPIPAVLVAVFIILVAAPAMAVLEVGMVVVVAPASPLPVLAAPAIISLPVPVVPVPVGAREGLDRRGGHRCPIKDPQMAQWKASFCWRDGTLLVDRGDGVVVDFFQVKNYRVLAPLLPMLGR
ncbi:hypothetical protein PVAP13_8NG065501 [Panicum virgatum]|uniref:Uncharacterized protein n=1 Tax=Panicum virgatum TaxID=38727 RepID=A0A8T0P2R8_PANVG|nr:hypothetical protein PVAP13_8NG085802 [Panicum virgatum]KAG2556050.1 hypothetical protein PVAP13_8NG065501 [Panicum virgatum]